MKTIIIAVVVMFVAIWGVNALNHSQCRNNVLEMGKPYRYDLVNGCRIGLDDGTFIYWQMYRNIEK